jgi:toxin ParE1/3/4
VNVRWSPLAVERVTEIARWISADRPDSAERLVDEIFATVGRLAKFPQSGRQVPEFRRLELREIIHRSFRIIYRVEKGRVEILTVRHSLQLLDEDDLVQ